MTLKRLVFILYLLTLSHVAAAQTSENNTNGLFNFIANLFKSSNNSSSKYIRYSRSGGLSYIADEKGNTIPDFSYVGYHQGNKKIPSVQTRITLDPPQGDARVSIQNAIDSLAKMPVDGNGIRGAILLKKGVYNISNSILIKDSGIILKGDGESTKLVATGETKRTLIRVDGGGKREEVQNSRVRIADSFIPVGAKSFMVESVSNLKVGDQIVVFRPGTQEWISDLKMDQIAANSNTRQWEASSYDFHFERVITDISGNRVTIDNPIVMEMEDKYGGAYIYKYTFGSRVREVGIENLALESEYERDNDENHGWIAIGFNNVENGWIRQITTRYFGMSAVNLGRYAKQITVADSRCLDPKSRNEGGRRYSFDNNGQLNLFVDLYSSHARHDYITNNGVLGPNVFYNCKAENSFNDIGPHQRWTAGTLYDNIVTDNEINVQDRGNWGTGHGWAGVTQVIWNCTAKRAAIQSPWVSGKNYAIGFSGGKYSGRLGGRPDGEWENHNPSSVTPSSLYEAQLNMRRIKLKDIK